MKTQIRFTAIAAFGITIATTSCNKIMIDDDIKSGGKVFDAATFKKNIIATLGNRSIGYNFVISQNGRFVDSAERGFARMSQDGAIKHSIYKEMNIASVSKFLTAAGALKLLSVNNIKVDDSIYKWLPQSWSLGAGVRSITFAQLLTHRSGLTTSTIRYATDYNSLRTMIGNPLANPAKGYNYSNVNFALFRIMFAYIENRSNTIASESANLFLGDTAKFADILANRYISLMQQYLFTPSGVSNALCTPTDSRSTATLMYNETATSTAGDANGDWKSICGGGGYYLSSYEVAKVMAYVFHTEDILTKAKQQEMLDNLYGLDGNDSPATNRGQAYGKGGALYNDLNGNQTADNPDQGLQTLVMKFPSGVELVFYINALNNGFTNNYATLMATAYENAWINK